MKHLIIYPSILFLMSAGFYACDSTTAPGDILKDDSSITDLSVSPNEVTFTAENDGYKDTTLTLSIEVTVNNPDDSLIPQYSISEKKSQNIIAAGELESSGQDGLYSNQTQVETSTISVEEYIINIFFNNGNGNYAQSKFLVKGFPNFPPEILEVDNPEEVEIPSGEEVIDAKFQAKVTDQDGQDNIASVFLNFRNEDGTLLQADPFVMLDDGENSSPGDSGDEVAQDSVYTITFSIDQSNSPNNRTALYWAIDKAGLSSDTVETTFNIVD